jgi:hypothetical protein
LYLVAFAFSLLSPAASNLPDGDNEGTLHESPLSHGGFCTVAEYCAANGQW